MGVYPDSDGAVSKNGAEAKNKETLADGDQSKVCKVAEEWAQFCRSPELLAETRGWPIRDV